MDLSYFFDTIYTIPPGMGSGTFTLTHWSILGVMSLTIYLIAHVFSRADQATRQRILLGTVVFIVVNEVFKDIMLLAVGRFHWDNLPLHLCGLNMIATLVYWRTKNLWVAEWLYGMSLLGGMVALISPNWAPLPLMNLFLILSNTVHAALVLFPILLLIDGFRPQPGRFLRVMPVFGLISLIIYPLNKLLEANFLFMSYAPKATPFEMFEAWLGNPGYLLAFGVLLALGWFLIYLPWFRPAWAVNKASASGKPLPARQRLN